MTRQNFLDGVDPAVMAALGDFEQREKLATMPARQRTKVKKDRERNGTRLRALDLNPKVFALLRARAEHEKVSMSNLAVFLIQRGLDEIERGTLDLFEHKEVARSLRFEYRLRLPAAATDDDADWGTDETRWGKTKK